MRQINAAIAAFLHLVNQKTDAKNILSHDKLIHPMYSLKFLYIFYE